MKISARIVNQVVIWSLVVLVLPMIVFPQRFGTNLAKISITSILMELVFYGIVLYIFNRHTTISKISLGAVVCLGYRLVLGVLLGLLIVIMYSMDFLVSMTLALGGYLPALVFQVLVTPFILWFVLQELVFPGKGRRLQVELPKKGPMVSDDTVSVSVQPAVVSKPLDWQLSIPGSDEVDRGANMKKTDYSGANGFEKATEYIGENGSVKMAAVVDNEGLLLGSFVRGGIDAEDWSPMALLFTDENNRLLNRTGLGQSERVSLTTGDARIIVAREKVFSLMVVADRQHDEVLNVRIEQALEMIRKYTAERYSNKLFVNAEKEYA
ncbi:MAG: hypothetical protein DRP47_01705 [Candidatus Zixiibacteriota bacterium]|nr:MAG: hypothetical protein DRP47_01705 [candidate division Zixibacteria bacterium]